MGSGTRTPLIHIIFSGPMLVAPLMGFSSGLPLLLTISVLQAWMKINRVDLTVIGMMALVGLPVTLKFLWAPVLDRYTLPFLGRRRGWLLVAQIALMLAIVGLGRTNPGKSPWMVAVAAFLVTFSSASQDIVIDAYRREDLSDEELGLGMVFYLMHRDGHTRHVDAAEVRAVARTPGSGDRILSCRQVFPDRPNGSGTEFRQWPSSMDQGRIPWKKKATRYL